MCEEEEEEVLVVFSFYQLCRLLLSPQLLVYCVNFFRVNNQHNTGELSASEWSKTKALVGAVAVGYERGLMINRGRRKESSFRERLENPVLWW